MVGFVMVSHSKKLAEGAVDLGLLMAPEVLAEAAGGLPHVKAADDSYWITGLEGSVPSSGFDALGAGYYKSATDSYEGLKTTARFWTATPSGNATDGVAVQCGVCESEEVLMIPKADGCSLRCVKINP